MQPEVFLPIIRPRMKQAREFAGLRVYARKVCAFMEIAVMTGERQILQRVFAFVLARHDVFDVKLQWLLRLGETAILTAILGTFADELAKPCIHQCLACASTRRALAWRIPMRVLAWM